MTFVSDFRHGLRLLRRAGLPGVIAISALAVGMAFQSAVIGLVWSVLLQPLPLRQPADLAVIFFSTRPKLDDRPIPVPTGLILSWRDRASEVVELAVLETSHSPATRVDLISDSGVQRIRASTVSPNFFEMLGASALVGRLFDAADENTEAIPIVILSHGFWLRHYGGRDVLGATLRLATDFESRRPKSHMIVGVLPASFHLQSTNDSEIWLVRSWREISREEPRAYTYYAIGRRGSTFSALTSTLTAISHDRTDARVGPMPSLRSGIVKVEPLTSWVLGDAASSTTILLVLTTTLLIMTLVLGADYLVGQTVERHSELRIRMLLGASRSRLLSQLLTESLVVIASAATVASACSVQLAGLLRNFAAPILPRGDEVTASWVGLVAAVLGVSVMTSGAVAVAVMRGHWRGGAGRWSGALRIAGPYLDRQQQRILLGVQAGCASILLIAAMLIAGRLWTLWHTPLGYGTENIETVEIKVLDQRGRDKARLIALQDALAERLRALNGVLVVGQTSSVPFGEVDGMWTVSVPGRGPRRVEVDGRQVDSEYFDVMSIPLLAGRRFTPSDNISGPAVAIVSQTFARQVFASDDPVGHQLNFMGPRVIVGVVGDVRFSSLIRPPAPVVYLPVSQEPTYSLNFVLKIRNGNLISDQAIEALVRQVDPTLPLDRVSTVERALERAWALQAFYSSLTATIGFIALLSVAASVFTTTSRTMAARSRDTAIQQALGAPKWRLILTAALEIVLPTCAGLVAAAVVAWMLTPMIDAFVNSSTARGPALYFAVTMVVLAATVAGMTQPLLKALSRSPVIALQS